MEEGLASTPEVTPHLAHFLHRMETTTYQRNKKFAIKIVYNSENYLGVHWLGDVR